MVLEEYILTEKKSRRHHSFEQSLNEDEKGFEFVVDRQHDIV